MTDIERRQLKTLRDGMLKHHKALLDAERAAYDRDVARITSAGQFLQLVLDDPWFAWLRHISQFIVLVDETLDSKEPVADGTAGRLIRQARELLSPSEDGSPFARRYFEAMQRDPSAVLSHGEMMRVLDQIVA